MFSQQDIDLIREKGITEAQIDAQLRHFREGFPYLPIEAAASVEKGIMRVTEEEEKVYLDAWNEYLKSERKIVKFVPASGAASRMFKDLFFLYGCSV